MCCSSRYLNGCACGEGKALDINYKGDIRQATALGFDELKFDGCGRQQNATKYAEYMQQAHKNFTIENCHWGQNGLIGCHPGEDSSACPSHDWSPFNIYRTGSDNTAKQRTKGVSHTMGWFMNLQDVVQ